MAKKISINEIKIGMVFTEPLLTEDNNIVIQAGVPIKEADYNRLVRWGIKNLITNGEIITDEKNISKEELSYNFLKSNEEVNKNMVEPEYKYLYNFCITLYNEFITQLQETEVYDKAKLKFIVNKIIQLVTKYKNEIISYMALSNKEYDYITTHSINTTLISIIGGKEYGLSDNEIELLGISALLHDIGMAKIPSEILNKSNKLTDEEFKIIKTHPVTAFKNMNKTNIFNSAVLDAILQHHEQYNGNGYPRKLVGEKISLFARFLAVSDAFEAQIAYRSYRKTKTGYLAMKSVLAEASNKFDPKVLRAYLNAFSIYPPGTIVQLNDNSIGTVTSINHDAPLRPKIKILIDKFGERIFENVVKDLKEDEECFILKVLDKDEYQKDVKK
ncbi:MAG: HD-GYP domain-containing protein [Spirochaetes bacterium]|nr:HD-GYP domain-containing protein [Spirochaetota bacterium]